MKSRTYHRDAIRYNEEIARTAERLAKTLDDPEVSRWCESIGKQHRFHAKRHKQALSRLRAFRKGRKTDDTPIPAPGPQDIERDQREHALADQITEDLTRTSPDNIIEQQAAFAAQKENVA